MSGKEIKKKQSKNKKANKTKELQIKKGVEEIDDLFSKAVSKRSEEAIAVPEEEIVEKKRKIHVEPERDSTYGLVESNGYRPIISPEAPLERIDPESGYPVYKAHLLKVGEGGGTELCPFDCDCCF